MSVKKIIQESVNKNPLGVKEALEEALQNRVRVALEEKYAEMMESKDEDDDDEDEDEDEDMDESFDLSDLTLEELEDFMMSEDFEQIDEISKKTLGSYIRKASDQVSDRGFEAGYKAGKGKSDDSVMKPYKRGEKRLAGISKAVDRLAK